MKKGDKVLEQFAALFRGYEHAHGQHELFGQPDEHGKIKGRALTKSGGAGPEQYMAHLEGKGTSLGMIMLMADNTCWFGAIDIDVHGEVPLKETVEALEKRVRDMELPLVVCKSKSGGAHLYLFGSEPLPAKLIQSKLAEFAAALGYGGTEVFPKQIMRVNEQDKGNWINIAYYGAATKEGTTRYCVRNGKPIPKLEDFAKYANQMRQSAAALRDVKLKLDEEYNDAPPCLQHLATFGLDQGGRNNALTNFAVFFKKKFPDDWQDKTMQLNYKLVNPPLPQSEVSQILKNISRKDYFYTCKVPPICNHCDKKACAKRDFGIAQGAGNGELFPIDNLTKCVSKDSVRWYAESQGNRIELTTEQLFSPSDLQRVFAERFTTVIIIGKHKDWLTKLKELMETCDEVNDPDDASHQGQFENLLDNFFTASRPARNKDELIKGNSYIEGGRVYFRSEDLFQYLSVRRFSHTPHEIWMWMKQMGAKATQLKIKGKNIRVWSIPEPEKYEASHIDLPTEVEQEEL